MIEFISIKFICKIYLMPIRYSKELKEKLRRDRLYDRSCRIHAKNYKPIRKYSEYGVWTGMLARCYNPSIEHYKYYGGRGIIVCDRWKKNFFAFLKDMGKRPSLKYSIDRRDNNGNYEPSNCRWVTAKTQARNTSRAKKYRLIPTNNIVNSPNIPQL